jgi:peptidoglycan/LPS O-acetylase OafA/YrhL
MSKSVSNFIDFFRWTAALQIVLIHAGNVLVNNGDIMTASHSVFAYVWWFVIAYAYGRMGVMTFFVFSGLLVGGALIRRMQRGDKFFRRYLIDRIVRIYIVLVPVILITFILDETGSRIFKNYDVYAPFAEFIDPRLVATTLASLQGIWFSTFGTNQALWSLSVECWYYIVFPLLVMPLALAYSPTRRLFGSFTGVVIFIALAWSGSYFALGFVPWVIGAAVAMAPRPLIRSRWISGLIFATVVTVIRLKVPGSQLDLYPTKLFTDPITALAAGNFLLTLRFDETEGFWFCRQKIHKTFADFSYSLYAVHMPILIFLWGITEWAIRPHWRAEPATFAHYAVAVIASAFVFVCAFALSRVTEHKTEPVRRLAYRLIPGGEKPRQPAVAS